mgnify:CR=1 FL=1
MFIWIMGACLYSYISWKIPLFRYIGLGFAALGIVSLVFHTFDYISYSRVLKNGNYKQVTGIPIKAASSSHRTFVFSVENRFFRCHSYSSATHASVSDCSRIVATGKEVRILYIPNAMYAEGKEGHLILKAEILDART